MAKRKQKVIAAADGETDPFLYGRKVRPFAWGFRATLPNGERIYKEWWGEQSTVEFLDWLEAQEQPYIVYFHNGGKFDMMFFVELKRLENPVMVINGRIVRARFGIHELRDSFAIMPFALAEFDKGKIDYEYFESAVRDRYKNDILEYLARDCESLFELVTAFWGQFGNGLTIGGVAIKEIQKFHPFERLHEHHDANFRRFYFGGRVQCFESGELKAPMGQLWKTYDLNSAYPDAMAHAQHPTGESYYELHAEMVRFAKNGDIKGFPRKPYFISFVGRSRGALPVRTRDGLSFPDCEGEFNCCSHEFIAARELGLITVDHITECYVPVDTINFAEYVAHWAAIKSRAKIDKDKTAYLFAKYLLNSSYGKFAQNSRNFENYYFQYPGDPLPDGDTWDLKLDYEGVQLWACPAEKDSYFDVCTAASITSYVRAKLMRAVALSERPIYCDTDSVTCLSFTGVVDPLKLGAWDCELTFDTMYIAGKKLYACYQEGNPLKVRSKGVSLTGEQIKSVCMGDTIRYERPAPVFKVTGEQIKMHRDVRMTVSP
jgi:hypothetical protein